MAKLNESNEVTSLSFSDFPEDVQLSILSFLIPSEIATFACTSKRFVSLCRNDSKLWFSLCDRRWGSKTQIRKWGNGKILYRKLYKILDEYENLIGFWRRSGQTTRSSTAVNSPPPLVFFDWGPFSITASRVSPSKTVTYNVIKSPFLWMGVTADGEPISFLDPECRLELSETAVSSGELGSSENQLVPVNVNFMGKFHLLIEENNGSAYWDSPEGKKNRVLRVSSSGSVGEEEYGSPGSPLDQVMSEIYQYFANRTNPGSNGSSRRQRRREKVKHGRRKWEPEYFVKIVNCSPTPSRPLQGLWKGICDDTKLDFYLVVYDDIGGIACRSVGDSSKPFSGYAPVFWTSNTTFIEPPFSPEENYTYENRIHLQPHSDDMAVSRILPINSSYDLVIPDLAGSVNPHQVEGRIWQYEDGTFGFGFLRDNYIIDLKHIARNGFLLDTYENIVAIDDLS